MPKRISAPQKQAFPANYFLETGTVSLASVADSGDVTGNFVDNSADLGGNTVHFRKIVIRMQLMGLQSDDLFIFGVFRQPEGDQPGDLETSNTWRDLRSQNAVVRGPWLIGGRKSSESYLHKAIVLKKFTLDANDDLKYGMTAVSATGADGQRLDYLVTGWYRKVS